MRTYQFVFKPSNHLLFRMLLRVLLICILLLLLFLISCVLQSFEIILFFFVVVLCVQISLSVNKVLIESLLVSF